MSRFSVDTVFRAIDRITRPVSRMAQQVGRATRSMESSFRGLNDTVDTVNGNLAGAGVAFVATAGGVVAGISAVNEEIAMTEMLAQALGVQAKTIEALGAAVKPLGFDFETIGDLIEEMNNKLGESAGLGTIGPVEESLAILGLTFDQIKQLAPEKQFERIANAALAMEDAQQAAAASDILLGGDANKVISILRTQGKTIGEIIGKYSELSVVTEESRKGAVDFTVQSQKATSAISSMVKEVSGLVGKALLPLINTFIEYIKVNKDLISLNIKGFFQSLVDSMPTIITVARAAGSALVIYLGFVTAVKVGMVALAAKTALVAAKIAIMTSATAAWATITRVAMFAIGGLKAVMLAINAVFIANPIGATIAAVTLLSAGAFLLIKNWDTVIEFFETSWSKVKEVLVATWSAVEPALLPIIDLLKNIADGIIAITPQPVVDLMVTASESIMSAWDEVGVFFEKLIDGISSKFSSLLDVISPVISATGDIGGKISEITGGVTDKVSRSAGKLSGLIPTGVKSFFGFGGDEQAIKSQPQAQVVTREESLQKFMQERRDTSEVTIRDETGRAEVTGGTLSPGIVLQPSGAF